MCICVVLNGRAILQVYYYDEEEVVGPSSDIQSHRIADPSEEDSTSLEDDTGSFVTAWGPETPANLADMTPGFWQGAGSSNPQARPPLPSHFLTPPPYRPGML